MSAKPVRRCAELCQSDATQGESHSRGGSGIYPELALNLRLFRRVAYVEFAARHLSQRHPLL